MLTSKKIAAYSKIVAGLPDVPSPALSALQLKQWFDTAPEEMRVAFNALIDNLISTATGDSGAESIGIEPIVGVSAANVQDALEQLKILINNATTGAIPDGSLGVAKLSFDPATQVELDAHVSDFTTHVEYALATGAANTYAVTLIPAPTSYVRGMAVSVEINALNTGVSTININGLGAKLIKKSNGNDVVAGNLKVGIIYTLRYNGTNFILQGEGGGGNAIAAHLLAGETATVDAGDIVGTMVNRAASTEAVNNTANDTNIWVRFLQGAYLQNVAAGYPEVHISDPDFIAANILSGKDIFGLTGTLSPGKKFASGTISSDSGAFLIVSGLTFTPSYILASRASDAYMRLGFVYNVDVTGTNNVTQLSDSATAPTWNASNYVNATGFKIQAASASTSYKWWAFE